MFEKISTILNRVDAGQLEEDLNKYIKYERMRQIWSKGGSPSDKIKPYLDSLNTHSRDVDHKLEQYQQEFEKICYNGNLEKTAPYQTFFGLFTRIRGLAKIFDVVSGSAKRAFNPENNKALADSALFGYEMLKKKVKKAIDDYAESANNRRLLEELIKAIKTIADDIEKFMDSFYKKLGLKVFNKYKPIYSAIRTSRERLLRGIIKPSISGPDKEEKISKAIMILSKLSGLAIDVGKNTESKYCKQMMNIISKVL